MATASERYVYAGVSLTHNLYNAFVQGQFRHSAFTVDRADIVKIIGEAWVDTSVGVAGDYKVDVFIRARTRKLRLADAESPAWGGLILSRTI